MRNPLTLPEILGTRAERTPDHIGWWFLRDGEEPSESLTYAELYAAATARAALLRHTGLAGGQAVLLYPAGLEFVRALLGCQFANVAGAPVKVPRESSGLARIRAIAADAATTTVLTTKAVRERFVDAPELAGLRLLATDDVVASSPDGDLGVSIDDTALLQYTSGSTGSPKGVVVSHRNFWHNATELDELWSSGDERRIVSWLPVFHDMGLLFSVVLPLLAGLPTYLMAPESFIRRPLRWLEAISRFRATHTAAPNFAYEMCVRAAHARAPEGLDLASWRVAVNGAEPVRWHTVRRFTETFAPHGFTPYAMSPGYGLAEHTLKVTARPIGHAPTVLWLSADDLAAGRVVPSTEDSPGATAVVGVGAAHPGTRVRVVDPDTGVPCPDHRVGEVWVSGPSVAQGYWGRPDESAAVFQAPLADGQYLRTGDLGFLRDGELYVTGRRKDIIIQYGRNHYPQDIEATVEAGHPGLHPSCAAAFAVPGGVTERVVVAVEVDGRVLRSTPTDALAATLAASVAARHGLVEPEVVLIRRGTLPRTSSGKVRRQSCRQAYLEKALSLIATVSATP